MVLIIFNIEKLKSFGQFYYWMIFPAAASFTGAMAKAPLSYRYHLSYAICINKRLANKI
jgi:hypothetical protein